MADPGSSTPLLNLFRRGEVPRDVRLLAARGALAPRAQEQMAILVFLATDVDAGVAAAARETLATLPRPALEAFLARPDAPPEVRAYFVALGIAPGKPAASADDGPLVSLDGDDDLGSLEIELEDVLGAGGADDAPAAEKDGRRPSLSSLPVIERMKLAMRGSREHRSVLIRDPNKMVSAAVLSSPKLTEAEVESFARMANVSEDVLRIVGSNRAWTRSYAVLSALAKNPRTPPTISMPLVARLNERDLKGLSIDRNVPEGLRIAARKLLATNESRRR
jgi:hypothetical protein